MTVAIGAQLPHTCDAASVHEIPDVAGKLEQAGFDSLWVSDHVVLPMVIRTHYPFADDGTAPFPTSTPFAETLTILAAAAAATTNIRLGTDVLVLPQRNPVLTAKQIATVDALSAGRLSLGVGAGWLAEEFAALNSDFGSRGARMVEWIDILRQCWTGYPQEFDGTFYHLPADTICLPTPVAPVPVFLGGHSRIALRRVGRIGDGWLAQQECGQLDASSLATDLATISRAAADAGRDVGTLRVTLRVVKSLGQIGHLAKNLRDLAGIGIHEVIIDTSLKTAKRDAETLREAFG